MRTLLPLSLALAGSAAVAYDPIVIARGWERIDSFDDGTCAGEVGSNGQSYVLSIEGMEPGETAFLTITNGDMRPIERAVRANAAGRWSDYYIPFRANRDGGAVAVTLASESCVVPLGFAWTRAMGLNETAPLRAR